jgi:hypothetical protein
VGIGRKLWIVMGESILSVDDEVISSKIVVYIYTSTTHPPFINSK